MRLTFLGVRGSTPAPGAEFVRYGGHTSCIAVARAGASVPSLLLDAGTGLRSLTSLLGGSAFEGSMLLSHLHWDHVQGIPFSPGIDRDDARVDVHLPAQSDQSARDAVARFLSPPAFPIAPEGLLGAWTFTGVEPGTFETDGFVVTAADIAHKGGRTYAYRVEADGAAIAYAPDHAPAAGIDARAWDLLADVDLLIHDAQFLEPERALAEAYGHSTVADAVSLAERVGARHLVLFHHGPGRTDDALDRILDGLEPRILVTVATQGLPIDVPAGTTTRR